MSDFAQAPLITGAFIILDTSVNVRQISSPGVPRNQWAAGRRTCEASL